MRCAFPACDHDSSRSSQISSRKVTFHRLPDEESFRAAWMEALGQTDWRPEPGSVVCSEHILVMDLLGTSTEHPLQVTKDLIISELQNYDAISSDPADNSNEGHFEFDTDGLDDVNKQTEANLDESPEDVKFTVDQNYIYGEDETTYVAKDEFKTENEGLNFIEESHLEDVVCDSIKGNSDIVNLIVKLENSEVIDKEGPSAEKIASHMASTDEDVLDDLTQLEGLRATTMKKTRRVVNEMEVDEQQTPEAAGPSTDDALRCDICHYQTDSDIQLLEHLKAHAASNNVRHKRNLQTHQLKKSPEKSYTCDACKKVFRKKMTLRRHLLIHCNEKRYSCDVCNKRFRQMGDLKCHQSMHFNEKPYLCDVCDKMFSRRDTLQIHQLIHSNEKPFSCDVSHKNIRQKVTLQTHQLTHSNERPYSCNVCNKRFRQKGHLICHLVTHSNERPYSCNVCNKGFKQNFNLKKHLLIHSNERPYSCYVCNKGFRQNCDLKRHLLIHSNERPYSCNDCNKGFRRKNDLKIHQLIHSNNQSYSCDVCNKMFGHKWSLMTHLLIHSNAKPRSDVNIVLNYFL